MKKNIFEKLKAKAKLPKRLCAKPANLAQSQNSIEATAQNSHCQTMLICRNNLNELPREEKTGCKQLIFIVLS
ncbi:hypothetical protein AUQ44_02105 [Vibrio cidicii]|uniref:Uncharacterized protein n=1 Tax=Vibrio cidicii TaxID=1763883 RepID=A0A151JG89_9VIBR|nr:hypothetical protein AUQ44_02105 [Vibrio cidicii]